MPLPTSFTTFTDGTTITAAEFNKRVVDVETYINGDIESSDLPTGMFVTSSIIVDPEFFGSPAPRVQLESSDVHFRRERGGTDALFYSYNTTTSYIPIPGLSATFHVAIPDGFPSQTIQAHVRCSFFAENKNSVFDSDAGFENNLLVLKTATFAMFVDGTEVSGTERKVYCACNADDPMAAQNISMVSMVELTRGTHDISIRIKPEVPADKNKFQHTVIRHRTLNIELYYL